MSVSMYFMFLWVFQWEVYGCVGRGWLPQYVNFKIRIFPDNKKVMEAYNPVAFMSRFELYVCIWFLKLLISLAFVRVVSYMINISSTHLIQKAMFFVSSMRFKCISSRCCRNILIQHLSIFPQRLLTERMV